MKHTNKTIFFIICLFLSACAPTVPSQELIVTVDALVAAQEQLHVTLESVTFQLSRQSEIISYLATRQIPVTQSVGIITPTPWDMVSGGVEIADGQCCAGGTAGDSINLPVSLFAKSNPSYVTHMRLIAGSGPFALEDLAEVEWQPYVQHVVLETILAHNWVGYWVGVQYRDAEDNLSDVYNSTISLEGMPAVTTISPTP